MGCLGVISSNGGGDADTEGYVKTEAGSSEMWPQASIRKRVMPSAGSAIPGSQVSGLYSCETVNTKCYTFLSTASRVVLQGRVSCSTQTHSVRPHYNPDSGNPSHTIFYKEQCVAWLL